MIYMSSYKLPLHIKSVPIDCVLFDTNNNPILQANQNKFTIQACCQQNFLLVVTIKIFNSSPCFLTTCSNINAITKPIAKI